MTGRRALAVFNVKEPLQWLDDTLARPVPMPSPLPTTTPVAYDRVFTRIAWRLMPLLIAGYVLNYLDRNNVGFAALTMNQEIGLTATQFGRAAGIFFLGYCFFEVPSNIALYKVVPRVWL